MHHPVRLAYDTRELGSVIANARKQRSLSQAELAERLGVNRMTVVRLERGDGVSSETVLAALSECGQAVAVVPKFSRVRVEDADG